MANPAGHDSKSPSTNDASTNALAREKEAVPGEVPVKQHDPDDKGINPGQKGPAQPSGSDA